MALTNKQHTRQFQKGLGQGSTSRRKVPKGAGEAYAESQGGGIGIATKQHRELKKGEPKNLKQVAKRAGKGKA